MPAQDRQASIDLLGENGARQFVRHRHRRQGKQQVRPRLPLGRQSIMAANQEYEVPGLHFGLAQQGGEAI